MAARRYAGQVSMTLENIEPDTTATEDSQAQF
jgi:hypothetical protein